METRYSELKEYSAEDGLNDGLPTPKQKHPRCLQAIIAVIALGTIVLLSAGWFQREKIRALTIPSDNIHEEPFKLSYTPQMVKGDEYHDVMINLNTSDPYTLTHPIKRQRYAILIPIFDGHYPQLTTFLHSFKCLCTDKDEVEFKFIASNTHEMETLPGIIADIPPCGETFSRWKVPEANINAPNIKYELVNMYDLLPHSVRDKFPAVNASSTITLLDEMGKLGYVSMKKLLMAFHFDYDWAIWMDAEAVAVRPFSIRQTIDVYVQKPSLFHSRMAKNDAAWGIQKAGASILGREINSFGINYWTMESNTWIIEKAVMQDLFQWVEAAHGTDFWTAFLASGAQLHEGGKTWWPFEINLHSMHVHARKLETVDPMFLKYQVLETERELIRFGMAPAFPYMEHNVGTGFLERGWMLLKSIDTQAEFSAFVRRYGNRLFRMDNIHAAPPEVVDRFLLESPIDLLTSGAGPLHEWWTERVKSGELNVTDVNLVPV